MVAEASLANLRKGGGRKKGSPNKLTMALKDMISGALDRAGGIDYLVRQSSENPVAFMSLVGRIVPLQANVESSITIEEVRHRIVGN